MEDAYLVPDEAGLLDLAERFGDDPVVMVNLIRFREEAGEPCEGMTGAEAYGRYSEGTIPFLRQAGARVIAATACDSPLIGPAEREWDMVILVEYPSPNAFLTMVQDPGYLEVHRLRAAALEDSRLLPSRPIPTPGA
ncbi:MAG: DUF1330 domain-containing protein [Solirubrobacterales bacterium]